MNAARASEMSTRRSKPPAMLPIVQLSAVLIATAYTRVAE
jgi:hypothetical protein